MERNLIITYDLYHPGQGYDRVEKAIKLLGTWEKLLQTVWYVRSTRTAEQARDAIWNVMDRNDKLLVVEASASAWVGFDADTMLQDWVP